AHLRDLCRALAAEEFRHRGFDGAGTSLVCEPGGAVEHEPHGTHARLRFGERMADRLMPGDGAAELRALLCIGPRIGESGFRKAERAGGEFELLDFKRAARELLPALVPHRLAAENVRG